MDKVLEIKFSGWTATPRLPFVLSGNALCMPVPPYSLVLGIIGCCLGRFVSPQEVKIGYRYDYDTVGVDIETRRRLQFDGKKIKVHDKGSDAYQREFHVNPRLTVWIDRTDWKEYFENPIGTPALGRSQDLLEINEVAVKEIISVPEAGLTGCMVPFDPEYTIPGQLMQLAEAYEENEAIGSGRTPIRSSMFVAIHPRMEKVKVVRDHLFQLKDDPSISFYLHSFYGD